MVVGFSDAFIAQYHNHNEVSSNVNDIAEISSENNDPTTYLGIRNPSFIAARDIVMGVNNMDMFTANVKKKLSASKDLIKITPFHAIIESLRYKGQVPKFLGERPVVRQAVNNDVVCLQFIREISTKNN